MLSDRGTISATRKMAHASKEQNMSLEGSSEDGAVRSKKPRICDWTDSEKFVDTLKTLCDDHALIEATREYARDAKIEDFLKALEDSVPKPSSGANHAEPKMHAAILPETKAYKTEETDAIVECDPKELALELVLIMLDEHGDEIEGVQLFVEHSGAKRIFIWDEKSAISQFEQRLKSLPKGSITGMFVGAGDDLLRFRFPPEQNQVVKDLKMFLKKKRFSMKEIEEGLRATCERAKMESDLPYAPNLVEVECLFGKQFVCQEIFSHRAKSRITVIAGEMGSGKTTYATHLFSDDPNIVTVYIRASPNISQTLPATNMLMNEWLRHLEKILLELSGLPESSTRVKRMKTFVFRCHAAWSSVRRQCHQWAQEQILHLLQEALDGPAKDWFLCQDEVETLDRSVFLVLDDVSQVPALANACMDEGPNILDSLFVASGKVKAASMAIVGSRLDLVMEEGSTFLNYERSNHIVLLMKHPDLEAFSRSEANIKVTREAVEGGAVSRLLATNARMLTTGVFDVLSSRFVCSPGYVDPKGLIDEALKTETVENQCVVGSFRPIMKNVLLLFMKHGCLGHLDRGEQESHLLRAFKLSLKMSLEAFGSAERCTHLLKGPDGDGETILTSVSEEHLCYLGLASRDPSRISPALKVLMCTGLFHSASLGQPSSFEDVVSLHVVRLCQLNGFKIVSVYELRASWLELAEDSPLPNANCQDVSQIEKILSHKSAVILRQDTAQGPPLIVLQLDVGSDFHVLNAVACQQGGTELSDESIATLGKTNLFSSTVAEHVTEKAKKVEVGITNLVKALNDKTKVSFQVATCIVAWDVPSCQVATIDSGTVQVWTREFLEPTVSAFPLGKE